ncbi:glycosyltransferase family 2 protein [Arenimonas alkanexedens]
MTESGAYACLAGANRPLRPVVSVCIANYQGEQLLHDCLASVMSQSIDGDIEILVHDDASPDGSVALMRAEFPEVTVLAASENAGFTVANNRMVDQARGTHVLLLNNDAALLPGAVQALLALVSADGGIATLPQYDWTTNELVDRGCLLDPFCNPVPNLDPDQSDVAMGIGACLCLPRALWHELGGLPEWMGSLAEDVFICGLARLHGHPVRVTQASGYRHRQGHSFGGNRAQSGRLNTTLRRRALSERNKTSALVVLTPGLALGPLLLLHWLLLLAEGMALTLLLRSVAPWRDVYAPALTSVFRQHRLLCDQRRRAQSGRRVSLGRYFATTRWWPRKLSLLGRYGLPVIR